MEKPKILKVKGRDKYVMPKNGHDFDLWELQEIVGGYVEFIPLTEHRVMIVDEDGKVKGKPVNAKATKLLEKSLIKLDVIVGDALVCEHYYVC